MSGTHSTAGARVRVQKFGTFLSGMVMPNIGLFIAWGLLAAFFIPTGWTPNEQLGELVDPIMKYLLPTMIGYTGGRMIHGPRGGAIGALATMGVVVGADVTMLAGGMAMGPFAAWVLKRFDRLVEGRIKPGLEMLVDNFSIGILGFGLAILGYMVVDPIFSAILTVLSGGMSFLVDHGLLPLTAIFVQPAQVLFLNNAINHGIMIPLGVEQVTQTGKSLLFLVEANGGVWTGAALAFAIFARGQLKKSAPAATFIMFLGGIAEVCFPYVLAKPKTILGPIVGNMAGLGTLWLLHGGTVGAVSPGSIIALIAMSPRDAMLPNLVGYTVALVVTCAVTGLMILTDRKTDLAAEASGKDITPVTVHEPGNADAESPLLPAAPTDGIHHLIFACDAGMGSSVMGVSKMRVKLRKAMLGDITIDHSAVKDLPESADAVITSVSLADRVHDLLRQQGRPGVPVFPLTNLLSDTEYDQVIEALRAGTPHASVSEGADRGGVAPGTTGRPEVPTHLLDESSVILGQSFSDRWEAISAAGQALVDRGCVTPSYIEDMIAREKGATVYVGNHVAIPHGIAGSERSILTSGVCCIQVPDGVEWGEEKAHVVFGIAGKDGQHINILAAAARVLSDPDNVETIRTATRADQIVDILSSVEEVTT